MSTINKVKKQACPELDQDAILADKTTEDYINETKILVDSELLPFTSWKEQKIKELGGYGSATAAKDKECCNKFRAALDAQQQKADRRPGVRVEDTMRPQMAERERERERERRWIL